MLRPGADVREQDNSEKCQKRKPRETRLSLGEHERGEERTERGAGVAADLEKRLRHAVLSAGSHARDARRFRVKHGGADAHEGRGSENGSVAESQCQSQQSGQADAHAHRQGIRLRAVVGIETDKRLEDGGGQLQREGDQAHLAEIKMKRVLEERIDSGDQRLQRVIQEVAKANREKNFEDSLLASVCRSGCPNCSPICVASHLEQEDRKSTRLNSSHMSISYAVFCLKKKKKTQHHLIFEKRKNKKKNNTQK